MRTEKVHIVGYGGGAASIFAERNFPLTDKIDEADILVFTGGQDINPALYEAKANPATYFTQRRDDQEVEAFMVAPGYEKLKVGICRGAQLLCALSGGRLYQHVDGHIGTHDMLYKNAKGEIEAHAVTSLHHQMMDARYIPHEHWAYARISTFREHEEANRAEANYVTDGFDPEITWFPQTCSLGFQGHPEFHHKESADVFFDAVERAIELKKNGMRWAKEEDRGQGPVFYWRAPKGSRNQAPGYTAWPMAKYPKKVVARANTDANLGQILAGTTAGGGGVDPMFIIDDIDQPDNGEF